MVERYIALLCYPHPVHRIHAHSQDCRIVCWLIFQVFAACSFRFVANSSCLLDTASCSACHLPVGFRATEQPCASRTRCSRFGRCRCCSSSWRQRPAPAASCAMLSGAWCWRLPRCCSPERSGRSERQSREQSLPRAAWSDWRSPQESTGATGCGCTRPVPNTGRVRRRTGPGPASRSDRSIVPCRGPYRSVPPARKPPDRGAKRTIQSRSDPAWPKRHKRLSETVWRRRTPTTIPKTCGRRPGP
mmetsp:Transcript_14933/g.41561  ORF Transcript_14933/g.41561 Transcript_14933/m.41561 type:complete len:245 (+) Transcript_14933:4249-4983(+)